MTAIIYQFPTGKTLDQLAAEYKAPTSIVFKDWDTGKWLTMSIKDFKTGKHRSVFNLGEDPS
jgi:hypothetical protein